MHSKCLRNSTPKYIELQILCLSFIKIDAGSFVGHFLGCSNFNM